MTVTSSDLTGLLDTGQVRADFPILSRRLDGDRPLVYLDSANTSQKPRQVLDVLADHYAHHNANVGRAVHQLGDAATVAYERARIQVAEFVNAPSPDEVVFTKNATEGLNLVANVLAWARGDLAVGAGDEIVITEMEHHSNIVPWQLLAERSG
ncbi:MAG: aminotransferase class V-fold PLP-dependent enzyme, partial [Nocardioidaceae bacterium]|nr:aminotransferase class V-fold PLP-dependent enzyme [Nocardioidaceae bacterium]